MKNLFIVQIWVISAVLNWTITSSFLAVRPTPAIDLINIETIDHSRALEDDKVIALLSERVELIKIVEPVKVDIDYLPMSLELKDNTIEDYTMDGSPFKYSFEKKIWPENHVIMFANILQKESGSLSTNLNQEIDKWLVAVTALRCYEEKGFTPDNVIREKRGTFKFLGSWRLKSKFCTGYREFCSKPKFTKQQIADGYEKAWRICYQIASKALNGEIPSFVPYMPKGTRFYHNKTINKGGKVVHLDSKWIRKCENNAIRIAKTIKHHEFYAFPKHMDKETLKYLLSIDSIGKVDRELIKTLIVQLENASASLSMK